MVDKMGKRKQFGSSLWNPDEGKHGDLYASRVRARKMDRRVLTWRDQRWHRYLRLGS
jgi:hypothetical protein